LAAQGLYWTRRGPAATRRRYGCGCVVAVAWLLLSDLILTFGAPPKRRSRRAKPAGRRTGMCFLCARFLCTSKERWFAPSRRENP
jgi:hypothetical protein